MANAIFYHNHLYYDMKLELENFVLAETLLNLCEQYFRLCLSCECWNASRTRGVWQVARWELYGIAQRHDDIDVDGQKYEERGGLCALQNDGA